MSAGRKPRRKGTVETNEALAGSADVQPEAQLSEAHSATAEEPSRQLSLMVIDSGGEPDATEDLDETHELDEPAEILVAVSSETLAGTVDEGDEYGEEVSAGGADEGAAFEGWAGASSIDEGGQSPNAPAGSSPLDQTGLEIRLARIHLRTGSLFMARAELEALAAREQLDMAAHLDLAEARWRTGDLHGAGEAAVAYLAGGGGAALGFVIAAEAFAMANRHAEARQHAELALERHLSELDPVFAGMPRRASWPARAWGPAAAGDAAALVPVAAPTVREAIVEVEPPAVAVPSEPHVEALSETPAEAEPVETPATTLPAAEPVAPADEPVATAETLPAETLPADATPVEAPLAETPAVESAVAPVAQAEEGAGAEVAAGRSFLDAGDPMMAALHFGVAIRLAPASAAAVLDAVGDRRDLPLQLVRGDALRLLGLEADAGNTYLSVASALGAGRPAAPEPPVEANAPAPEPTVPPITEALPIPEEPPAPEPPAPPIAKKPPAPPIPEEPPPLRWE